MGHCRQPRRRRFGVTPEEEAVSMPVASTPDPLEQLRFIRQTMESAGSFTAVPGWGTVALGLTAIAASIVAAQQPTPERWLGVWFAEAAVGIGIAGVAMLYKAEKAKQSLTSGPAKKFALGFAPPLAVGALLTLIFYKAHLVPMVPALWLLLYGVAVLAAGAFSVRIVPVMGICFLLLGGAAVVLPPTLGDWEMAVGFGGLHLIFGAVIARKHGG